MPDSVNTFMTFYVGDYLKKTTMLSCEEHGAYFLLLCSLWQNDGYLENDNRKLAKIVGVSAQKFSKIMSNISKYFDVGENGISNGRLLEELDKARQRRVRAQVNGRNGGRPKQEPSGIPSGIPSGLATGNPEHNPEKSSSPSPSPSVNTNTEKSKPKKTEFAPPTLDEVKQFVTDEQILGFGYENWFTARVKTQWVKSNGAKVKNWKLDLRTSFAYGNFKIDLPSVNNGQPKWPISKFKPMDYLDD
jgi:uncharacterized protein YdaU (DUF1376 family)